MTTVLVLVVSSVYSLGPELFWWFLAAKNMEGQSNIIRILRPRIRPDYQFARCFFSTMDEGGVRRLLRLCAARPCMQQRTRTAAGACSLPVCVGGVSQQR